MDTLDRIKPRLRQDVIFLETMQGAYVRNADTAFVMKGRSAYRWLATLAPYMDGQHTVAELAEGLDPGQVETIQGLVGTLLQRGLVRDAAGDDDALPEPVAQRFARQIAFVDHFVDAPQRAFAAYRDARVLLVGEGELARSTGASLLRNGLAGLALVAGEVDADAIADAVTDAQHADAQDAAVQRLADAPDDLAGYDVVVACAHGAALDAVRDLAHRSREAGAAFLPALVLDGSAFVGPLSAGPHDADVDSLLLRLTDNGHARHVWREVALGARAAARRAPLPALLARMLGNMLALEVFKHRTGALTPETAGAVVVQDLVTLESHRERLLAHPLAIRSLPAAGEPRDDELEAEATFERAAVLVSSRVGMFTSYTDDELTQIPLKIGRLAAPVLEPESAPGGQVVGLSADHVLSARLDALDRAVRAYAVQCAAAAEQLDRAAAQAAADSVVEPSDCATWTGAGGARPSGWLLGHSLEGAPIAVPAGAVLARPATRADAVFEPTLAGTGAATTAEGALDAALDSALALDRLRALAAGGSALVPVRLDTLEDADLLLRLQSLRNLSDEAWVAEVVGDGGVHVAVGRAAAGPATVAGAGWGRSWHDAVAGCLLQLGGRLQCLADGVDIGDPEALELTDLSLDAALPTAGAQASRREEGGVDRADLQRGLADAGRAAVAVDLTPPDLAALDLFRVARVLLVAAQPSRLSGGAH